ncbi:MAG: acetyl-CoA carboxylase biotin carboxyl carrier protein [Chlamydiia bacterium]|nr:acetyl-CoA carboxylase biotin carboxyl carrier protein [Chlamydiia bacterium]
MNLESVKELMALMEERGFKKITWKTKEGEEITLEQQEATPVVAAAAPQIAAPVTAPPVVEEGNFITSPMVGTFYTSAAPQDPSFVKVGDTVTADTVICIIEAMKVMNEIKAGEAGVIAEVLVNNGEPVEFGTKLLRIT